MKAAERPGGRRGAREHEIGSGPHSGRTHRATNGGQDPADLDTKHTDRGAPDPRSIGPITFEGLEKEGTAPLRRRIFRTEVFLVVLTLLVAIVLAVAVQTRVAFGQGVEEWASITIILGTVVVLTHIQLARLAHEGRLVEVRHWTWLLLPIHIAWGSGLLAGVPEAVPIGIGLGMLDMMVLIWLRDVAVP